jgi:FkbM family methyltransferase
MDNNSIIKNISAGVTSKAKSLLNNRYKKVNLNWFSLKYLKHVPANKIHSHELLHHKTFLHGGPEYLHGLQEIFLDDIYDQQLPENSFILDCGAHIGLSVIYLKNICPSARIVCFEPDGKNFDLLQKNILSHGLKNIEPKNEAVWNENTSLHFIQEGNMGSKIGEGSSDNTVTVKATRLKDYITQKVDFLKLDIEGAEYKVLKDIADNLGFVNNMFVEYHGSFAQNDELVEIFGIIRKAGFKFYIKEAAPVYDQPFLPKKTSGEYDVQLNIFCFKKKD